MVQFDPNLTEMIFFDLEFYVPEEERDKPGASLLSNPCKEGQFLLGGVFTRYWPLKNHNIKFEFEHFWIWKLDSEEEVLNSIYNYFMESWNRLENKDPRQADLILCGQGISRYDVPILYIRSIANEIDEPDKLFECYFKTKQVDLSNVAIPYFNRGPRVMYPKTTNQILGRFSIKSEKSSGIKVWEMYDARDYDEIEDRTENEVRDCIEIYRSLYKIIYGKGR